MNIGRQVSALQIATSAPEAIARSKSHTRDDTLDPPAVVDGARYCELGRKERISFNPTTGDGDPRCQCASACFFIWAAGRTRLGSALQIHRPYFDKEKYAALPPDEARNAYEKLSVTARKFLDEVGVPNQVVTRMFSVSSDQATYLTPAELSLMRHSPYFQELMSSKCGPEVSPADIQKGYVPFHTPGAAITPEDEAARQQLITKLKCKVKAEREIFDQTKAGYLARYR
jgi:hypothetical protein